MCSREGWLRLLELSLGERHSFCLALAGTPQDPRPWTHTHPLCRRSPAGELVSWPGAWRSSGQGWSPPRWQPCWMASLLRPAAWPPASPPLPQRVGQAGLRWGDAPARPPLAGARAGGCGAVAWGPLCRRCCCRWGSGRAGLLRSQGDREPSG